MNPLGHNDVQKVTKIPPTPNTTPSSFIIHYTTFTRAFWGSAFSCQKLTQIFQEIADDVEILRFNS